MNIDKQAIDFSQPLETESGEPVKYICHDLIEYKCARVCVDIATGIVYSSPYVGLKIRNKEANPRSKLREQIESAADAYWQFDNGWISDMKCGDLSHEYLLFAKEPKNVLALLDENIQLQREKDATEAVALALRDDMRDAREKLEDAEKRIAELESKNGYLRTIAHEQNELAIKANLDSNNATVEMGRLHKRIAETDRRNAELTARIELMDRRIAELERSETQLINERDYAESALNDAYKAVMGQAPEWSNWFSFENAIDEIELACELWRNQTDDVIQFRQRIQELEREKPLMVDAMHVAVALNSAGINLNDFDNCVSRLHEWGGLPDYCVALYLDYIHGVVSENKLLDFGYISDNGAFSTRQRIGELEAKLETADRLQDSAFRDGLKAGFSYGQTNDQSGFTQCLSAYSPRAGIGAKQQQDSVDSDVGGRNQPGMVVAVHIDAGDFVKVKGQVFEVEETDFDDHDVTLWFVGGNALKCAAGCLVEVVAAPSDAGIKVIEGEQKNG